MSTTASGAAIAPRGTMGVVVPAPCGATLSPRLGTARGALWLLEGRADRRGGERLGWRLWLIAGHWRFRASNFPGMTQWQMLAAGTRLSLRCAA